MGQSDNNEDSTYSRHQDLCQKLNMDAISASDAWKSYQSIRQNYILEVTTTFSRQNKTALRRNKSKNQAGVFYFVFFVVCLFFLSLSEKFGRPFDAASGAISDLELRQVHRLRSTEGAPEHELGLDVTKRVQAPRIRRSFEFLPPGLALCFGFIIKFLF